MPGYGGGQLRGTPPTSLATGTGSRWMKREKLAPDAGRASAVSPGLPELVWNRLDAALMSMVAQSPCGSRRASQSRITSCTCSLRPEWGRLLPDRNAPSSREKRTFPQARIYFSERQHSCCSARPLHGGTGHWFIRPCGTAKNRIVTRERRALRQLRCEAPIENLCAARFLLQDSRCGGANRTWPKAITGTRRDKGKFLFGPRSLGASS